MKCPKCGNELKEGNLYCEKCGEEVYIVPDFEPEIENSISDVLNDVAGQISPEKTQNIGITQQLDTQDELFFTNNSMVYISKKLFITMISTAIALVVLCIGIIIFISYRDGSYDYQNSKAEKAFKSGNYQEAIDYYEDAFRLDRNNTKPLFEIAKIYEMQGNFPKAEEIYSKIIGYEYDSAAMEKLIEILIYQKRYNDINSLLLQYGDKDIQLKYIDYMAKSPGFSVEEGTYDEQVQLELIPSTEGTIYYTLDGSEPGSDCNLYTEPITLKNGEYIVNAVFVNANGICSDIASHKYLIKTDIPDSPTVMPADGIYNVPQLITVIAPQGTNVYYTTDDSTPTGNSAIYTDPIAMPVGESTYHFMAINSNGSESEEIICKYSLSVDTVITQEQALEIVKNRQYEIGRVVSPEGDVAGSEGKYMYTYSELRYIQNRTLYFVSEYYQEGTIRMSTGNIFAVDVYDGQLYQVIAGSNNTYTLRNF